jgi:hypothetical protein
MTAGFALGIADTLSRRGLNTTFFAGDIFDPLNAKQIERPDVFNLFEG